MPDHRLRTLATTVRLLLVAACTSEQVGGPKGQDPAGRGSNDPTSTASSESLMMLSPRAVHRATPLADGRILVTGGCALEGCGGFEAAQASELYEPGHRLFRAGPRMVSPRAGHSATLLEDGRVLIVGGYPGEGRAPHASAEVFDPASDKFSPVGSLGVPRADHSATAMPDGRVLVAGGTDGSQPLASTETFDPVTGEFSSGPDLRHPRSGHAAALVGGDLVLVGGTADGVVAVDDSDILRNGEWAEGPRLRTGRVKHAVVALPDSKALVVGGSQSVEGRNLLDSTELLTAGAAHTAPGPKLSEGEYKLDSAVAVLPGGLVVIAGGSQINVYDPRTNRIRVLESTMSPRRSFVTASALPGGRVLVAGGYDSAIRPTAQARLIRVKATS